MQGISSSPHFILPTARSKKRQKCNDNFNSFMRFEDKGDIRKVHRPLSVSVSNTSQGKISSQRTLTLNYNNQKRPTKIEPVKPRPEKSITIVTHLPPLISGKSHKKPSVPANELNHEISYISKFSRKNGSLHKMNKTNDNSASQINNNKTPVVRLKSNRDRLAHKKSNNITRPGNDMSNNWNTEISFQNNKSASLGSTAVFHQAVNQLNSGSMTQLKVHQEEPANSKSKKKLMKSNASPVTHPLIHPLSLQGSLKTSSLKAKLSARSSLKNKSIVKAKQILQNSEIAKKHNDSYSPIFSRTKLHNLKSTSNIDYFERTLDNSINSIDELNRFKNDNSTLITKSNRSKSHQFGGNKDKSLCMQRSVSYMNSPEKVVSYQSKQDSINNLNSILDIAKNLTIGQVHSPNNDKNTYRNYDESINQEFYSQIRTARTPSRNEDRSGRKKSAHTKSVERTINRSLERIEQINRSIDKSLDRLSNLSSATHVRAKNCRSQDVNSPKSSKSSVRNLKLSTPKIRASNKNKVRTANFTQPIVCTSRNNHMNSKSYTTIEVSNNGYDTTSVSSFHEDSIIGTDLPVDYDKVQNLQKSHVNRCRSNTNPVSASSFTEIGSSGQQGMSRKREQVDNYISPGLIFQQRPESPKTPRLKPASRMSLMAENPYDSVKNKPSSLKNHKKLSRYSTSNKQDKNLTVYSSAYETGDGFTSSTTNPNESESEFRDIYQALENIKCSGATPISSRINQTLNETQTNIHRIYENMNQNALNSSYPKQKLTRTKSGNKTVSQRNLDSTFLNLKQQLSINASNSSSSGSDTQSFVSNSSGLEDELFFSNKILKNSTSLGPTHEMATQTYSSSIIPSMKNNNRTSNLIRNNNPHRKTTRLGVSHSTFVESSSPVMSVTPSFKKVNPAQKPVKGAVGMMKWKGTTSRGMVADVGK